MSHRKPIALALSAALIVTLAACHKGSAGQGDGAANAAAPVAPPAGTDWTQVVAATPEGGFVMGNPKAAIKLVEYQSDTCPHCADFEQEAYPTLEGFVKSGRMSFEQRSYLLNAFDVPISILTRCNGAASFFPLTRQFYEQQRTIMANKIQPAIQANQTALENAFKNQDFYGAAKMLGVIDFFTSRGVTEDKARACLNDKARVKQLVDMRDTASNKLEVNSTPSFFINGEAYDFTGWPAMKKKLSDMGLQ